MLRPSNRPDGGSVTPLVLGLAVVLLLLVSVVAAASQAFVQRRSLASLADGAAVAAAQAIAHQRIYVEGVGDQLPVSHTDSMAAVHTYVSRSVSTTSLQHVAVADVRVDREGSVRVSLTARADVPLPTPVTVPWSDGVPISASARATIHVR